MTTAIEWADGAKWCTACKDSHARSEFGRDPSRGDGLDARCLASRRVKVSKQRTEFKRHGWLSAPRDGDRLQARRRVNYLVEQGRIPAPGALPCMDCGHVGDDRRHEYDHARGYEAEYQLYVEPVCSSCHHARERGRAA